ncbi:MAG: GNAT family N-acetyltransferase [Actinomycetales bacterium]
MGHPNDAARVELVVDAELAEAREAAEQGNGGQVAGLWWMVFPGLPHPWAARVYAFETPEAAALAAAETQVRRRAASHRVLTRAGQGEAPVFVDAGLRRVEPMPVFALDELRPPALPVAPDGPRVVVRPARDAEEFVAVYGADLRPLVEPALSRHPDDFLVAVTAAGDVAACARVTSAGRTVRVSAVTVAEPLRGKGIGSVVSYEACRAALQRQPELVWLHSQARAVPVYERLGFRHLDDHVQLERV